MDQDPDGDAPCPDKGIAELGVMHDCRAPNWILFDGNILHCTEHVTRTESCRSSHMGAARLAVGAIAD